MTGLTEWKPGWEVPRSGTYKCWFCSAEGLKDFADALLGQAFAAGSKRPEVFRAFLAGTRFSECPNCGAATIWHFVSDELPAASSRSGSRGASTGCLVLLVVGLAITALVSGVGQLLM